MPRSAKTLVITLAILIPNLALAQEKAPSGLAERCNAIPWPEDQYETPLKLEEIRQELIKAGKEALPRIEVALPRSQNLRRIASSVLAEWPCDRTRALLLGLLKDQSMHVAELAAFYLGDVGGKEVIPELLEAAKNGRGMLCHNALNALMFLGQSNQACDIAIERLESRESWIRHSAVSILAHVDVEERVKQAIVAVEKMVATEKEPGTKAEAERTLLILKVKLG